jgi:N-acetylglucosamine kinase-like BadF-type ATPase
MGGSQVQTELLLGMDGGGTRCRARLGEPSGAILGEGSGAWLGCEAVRRVLWAQDGRVAEPALSAAHEPDG